MTTYLSPRDPEGDRLRVHPLTGAPRLLFSIGMMGGTTLDRAAVAGLVEHLTGWLDDTAPAPAGGTTCGLCRVGAGVHAPWCLIGQAQRQGSGQ